MGIVGSTVSYIDDIVNPKAFYSQFPWELWQAGIPFPVTGLFLSSPGEQKEASYKNIAANIGILFASYGLSKTKYTKKAEQIFASLTGINNPVLATYSAVNSLLFLFSLLRAIGGPSDPGQTINDIFKDATGFLKAIGKFLSSIFDNGYSPGQKDKDTTKEIGKLRGKGYIEGGEAVQIVLKMSELKGIGVPFETRSFRVYDVDPSNMVAHWTAKAATWPFFPAGVPVDTKNKIKATQKGFAKAIVYLNKDDRQMIFDVITKKYDKPIELEDAIAEIITGLAKGIKAKSFITYRYHVYDQRTNKKWVINEHTWIGGFPSNIKKESIHDWIYIFAGWKDYKKAQNVLDGINAGKYPGITKNVSLLTTSLEGCEFRSSLKSKFIKQFIDSYPEQLGTNQYITVIDDRKFVHTKKKFRILENETRLPPKNLQVYIYRDMADKLVDGDIDGYMSMVKQQEKKLEQKLDPAKF